MLMKQGKKYGLGLDQGLNTKCGCLLLAMLSAIFQSNLFQMLVLFSCTTTNLMGYRPLLDFPHLHLTKLFPMTPSAIQPIGTTATFCINKTVPSFLDVIPFQSLDVAIFVVVQLNYFVFWPHCIELECPNKIIFSVFFHFQLLLLIESSAIQNTYFCCQIIFYPLNLKLFLTFQQEQLC